MLLQKNQIKLRAMEPSDVKEMFLWENDTTLWSLGDVTAPFSKSILSTFIENSHLDIYQQRQMRLIIELLSEDPNEPNTPIGAIDLFDFEPLQLRAAVGILIYDNKYRGKGYAQTAIEILSGFAAKRLSLNQLYAHIPMRNQASVALFAKCGFEQSGVLKRWAKCEVGFEDVMVMQRLFKEIPSCSQE